MLKRIIFSILVLILVINLYNPVFSSSVPIYDCISFNSDYQSIISVMKNNKWGVADINNKQIVPFKYSDINALGKGFNGVKYNDKWGVIDPTGKLIINIKYDQPFNFSDGYFINSKGNKFVYFDTNGNEINNKYPGYDYYALLSSKYIAVGKTGEDKLTISWGIIDSSTGTELIKPQFPETVRGYVLPPVLINESGLFGFVKNLKKNPDDPDDIKCGIVDIKGKIILPFEYEPEARTPGIVSFSPFFADGLSLVQNNVTGKSSYINNNGKIVFTLNQKLPVSFLNSRLSHQPFNFSDGMCRIISSAKIDKYNNITYDGKWGFIDKTGKIIIKMQYENVSDFYNGFAAVKKNGKVGLINKAGKEVIPIIYDVENELFDYTNKDYVNSRMKKGMISVGKKGKYGVVNFTGKTLIPFSYDEPLIYNSENGLFSAKKSGKFGYIDTKNRVIIPLKYQSITSFKNGISVVKYGKQYGAINKTGKIVIPYSFDSIYRMNDNLLYAYKGGITHFFNNSGKEIFNALSLK